MRLRRLLPVIGVLLIVTAFGPCHGWAQAAGTTDNSGHADAAVSRPVRLVTDVVADVTAYTTAPLRWDGEDWLYFGAAIVATGAAYHYDERVRAHFTGGSRAAAPRKGAHNPTDALPAAAAVAGTWLYATVIDDDAGRTETWSMLEAAALSSATGQILKYATGRKRPDETTDRNRWGKGGDAFPSGHVTAAFAIGTVLAESGNDRYRWIRRVAGYGLAAATAQQRLKHNAHWLSDTVAGAALGMATAHFVMNRATASSRGATVMLMPLDRGAVLTFSAPMR